MRKFLTFRNIVLIAIGLSGMAALIYEVVWTRMLSLIFGSTVYAVATMLCAFMAGLALGSYLMARKVDKIKNLAMYFGLLQLGIGIYGILFLFSLNYLRYPYFLLYQAFHNYFWLFIFAQFLLYFLVLLIPTIMFGAIFPLATKIFTKGMNEIGKGVGYIYSANSLGSVLGPFLAGFILIPLIGVSKTTVIAAAVNIFVGLIILRYSKLKKDVKFFLPIVLIFLVIGWQVLLPPILINFYFAGTFRDLADAKEGLSYAKPIFYKEGPYSTIVVAESEGHIGLKSDGRGEASTYLDDMRSQTLLAYIPMLLHSSPEKVLNIGMGAGITLGAMGEFEAKEIHGIEVEPAIIKAAKQFFSKFNNNILDDPRVTIFRTDGRNQLLMGKEKYDVIISAVSHPINPGSSHLYTKEFFELTKSRLNENGIFLHFIPGHRFSIEEHKIVAKTFFSVFPHTSLWIDNIDALANPSQINVETYLIGSLKSLEIDKGQMKSVINSHEKIKENLKRIGINSTDDFLSLMIMDERGLSNFLADENRINTDDRPILEFMVLKSLLKMKFVTLSDIIQIKQ